MGCAFSFLTSSVRSRTSELVPNVNALSNDENVDKQQNESENCIRTQGSVCFSDSDLNSADQNRDQVLKGKPAIESVNGATYNLQIQIRDSGIVLIGDNNNIDFRQPPGKDMRSITEVDAPPMDMTNRTTAPVDAKTQISTTAPVTYVNITANNVIVGDRNEIKMPSRSDRVSTYDSLEILGLFTNVALASIFRREGEEGKKLGSASDCLENAKQSGESLRGINFTIPKFALALLHYEQGRLWPQFAKMTLNPKSAKAEAFR